MRFFICLLLFLWSFAMTFSQNALTLEDIWQKGTFTTKGVSGFHFQKDGLHYTRSTGTAIEQYDLRDGSKTGVLFDTKQVSDGAAPGWKGTFDNYTWSSDESCILLETNSKSIYRRSNTADFFVYRFADKNLLRLHTEGPQRDAFFSPDASKVAYIAENNLFYFDLNTQKTVQVTSDGQDNAIINGAADWVYEEEFSLVRAFDWSPDGKWLAFLRFDESAVPLFTLEMYRDSAYPQTVPFKYPKVSEKNATVTAHFYELKTGKLTKINLLADSGSDFYLPRLQWTPRGLLCLTWMNRLQNHERLLLADPSTGRCSTLIEEKNARYIDLQDVTFLSDGSGFIKQSEKSGFNHLYLYDMQGRQKKALTKGPWEVTDFYGVDERNQLAYYQAAVVTPLQREIYVVNLKGKKRKKISDEPGTHSVRFSKTFDYAVCNFSTIQTPPRSTVRDRNGRLLRVLEQNTAIAEKQRQYGVLPVTFFKVPLRNAPAPSGTWNGELNGWMIRPTAPAFANQKLPVLMFVYGGPGSQQVTDAWKGGNYWWFQMLAQQGYVVACVDNRGTGARGEDFKKMTYLQLGKYETEDQIAAARYLATLPYIDAARIGIFGWSYGGYLSSLCLFKGPDVFKAAIAVAPVTNWKWYDSIYTERYMQTYTDNPSGYEENSPVNFAGRLKGNYLLVHGLADDNVHFQNAAELVNHLIAAGRQFDSMYYPNRNHGISGGNARIHLYTKMTNFLKNKL